MIYLNCTGEIIMSPRLFRIERKARLFMGGFALLTILFLLLVKTQLIQTQPSFDTYSWYAVSNVNAGMTVTHKADNEAACRVQSRLGTVTCLQGRSLNTAFFAQSRIH